MTETVMRTDGAAIGRADRRKEDARLLTGRTNWTDNIQLPGTLLMHSGGRPVGDAPADLRRAVQLHSCQTLTPETETKAPISMNIGITPKV